MQAALDAYLETVKRFVASAASIGAESPEITTVAASLDEVLKPIHLPDDPMAASYAVGGVLQIELTRKQQLLELPGCGQPPQRGAGPAPSRSRGSSPMAPCRRWPPPTSTTTQTEPIRSMSPARRRRAALLCALLLSLAAAPVPSPSPNPSGSGDPTRPASPSVPASVDPSVPPPSPSAGGAIYVVVGGDTLFSIARAWSTTVAQLQAWNAERYPSLVTNPDGLEAGWVLIVAGDPSATPVATSVPSTPTPAPTAPPPVGSGCRAGNRVAAGSPQTFYTIPGAGRAVALTFDMGGRLDPGVDILNFLVRHHVCATLFPTGAMAQTDARAARSWRSCEPIPELFEIGNHTMHHCDLVRGGGGSPTTAPCAGGAPTAEFIRRELTDARPSWRARPGQQPEPYWRPPYGSINDAVIRCRGRGGLHQDLHVGHRHDRLEADRRRRPDGRADRDQGRSPRPRTARTC